MSLACRGEASRLDRRLCVAPMMDWTDRHCRYFHRQLAPGALLYTEMVTTGAVIHGDRDRLLGFDPAEHSVALQLGGSDPDDLARAACIGAEFGYDEINLNVGCPSDRVQRGRFGACLMKEPGLVAECLAAMAEAVSVPVTVKTRLGVDDHDSEAFLHEFVEQVAGSGIQALIIHARKAWLSGLSPKQNREVPPLNYDRAWRIRQSFPGLELIINGGIVDQAAALGHLQRFDGIMLGRAAYQDPWLLARLSQQLGQGGPETREAVVEAMAEYAEAHLGCGGRLGQVGRHMLGLFRNQPGGRGWRQTLSECMHADDADPELLLRAIPQAQATHG